MELGPKENTQKKLIENGADYVGSAASATVGAVIGSTLAGPVGAALGGLAGKAIEKAIQTIGTEIKHRVLSQAETRKVETVYTLAVEFITENLNNNKKLRKDDFFDEKINGRSSAEEILEGTLLVAQREYEERKLKYLAKLYANIAFSPEITSHIASFLLKLVDQMTYRQIIILQSVGIAQLSSPPIPFQKAAYSSVSGINNVTIAAEIYDLYRMSILTSSQAILDSAGINPSALSIGGYGAHLFNLMELKNIFDDSTEELTMRNDIFAFLMGTSVREI